MLLYLPWLSYLLTYLNFTAMKKFNQYVPFIIGNGVYVVVVQQ